MSSRNLGSLCTGSILDNLDILTMIMCHLALPQLRVLSETCRIAHCLALYLMKRWLEEILSPYIFEYSPAFAHVLRRSGGVIVGSCALRMLLGRCGPEPRDLNILVAHGSFDLMDRFLKRGLGYESVPGVVIHPIFTPVANCFEVYTFQGKLITVTEPKLYMNVTHIIFRGTSTADMTCMTSGGMITFYPQLTQDHISIKTRAGEHVPAGQKLGCVGGMWFDIYSDTNFLGHACGDYCPTVWRHISHHDEYVTLEWDKSYGIKRLLRDADIKWRLNEYCVNTHCDFRLDATVENPPLPLVQMPADEFDVEDTREVINAHVPHFHKLYRGLLYATACLRPILVDVPLQDGLDHLLTLDDLEVGFWVHQKKGSVDIASRSKYRKTYELLPNFTIALDDVYTLFFENNDKFPPPNTLLDAVVPEVGSSVGLTGNMLVVKVMREDRQEIVDMCEADLFLTNFVLRSVLNKSNVCGLD